MNFCEDCGIPARRWFPDSPCLCPFCSELRWRKRNRQELKAARLAERSFPRLSDVTQKNTAVATWSEIAFVLGVDQRDAQRCLRKALQRIKDSGCDVAMLFDQLHSHRLFHKARTSVGVAARLAIEAWQMEADILEPEAPVEAEAIRREVEALKKAIK